MERIPVQDLGQLDLGRACREEAGAWRNLVPPEPWLQSVAGDPDSFAEWVAIRLRSGARNAPAAVVNAWKSGKGVRPVPIIGIGERIAYRAITNFLLQDLDPPARSADDYRDFVNAPIKYAYEGLSGIRALGDARLGYVVEADIVAFYQYIDHGILRQELELQTGYVSQAAWLTDLLKEIQGTIFGLPQLLTSSDELSEVYIKILERDLIRQGLAIWRYNDDFRVGATAYSDAFLSIERLSNSARGLGLVLNDQKTFVYRFLSYLIRYAGSAIDHEDAQIDPNQMETQGNDYMDLGMTADQARSAIQRVHLASGDDRLDVKNLRRDDLRLLRAAISTLKREGDPSAIPYLATLFLFVPSLTPRIGEYLVGMADNHLNDVMGVWDSLIQGHTHSLSDWQCVWLTYVARECGLLSNLVPDHEARVDWMRAQILKESGGLLHAEASLCLARVGAIGFAHLDVSLRMQPEALTPWYILGINALASLDLVLPAQVRAVAASSKLFKLLLGQ